MLRHGHELAAGTLVLATFPTATAPLVLVGAVAVAATCSHGVLSPDINLKLGIGHRLTTHTLEYVAVAGMAVVALMAYLGASWVGWAIAAGWLSHELADGVFGGIPSILLGGQRRVKGAYRGTVRGPYRIRTKRIGFHFRTGGPLELALYGILPVLMVGLVIVRILGRLPW